ncbi:MAG TPA: tRNA (adenosine(37)-N6)-threonylcarbamoyltransferase complex dimerization subunit type 1 TsaB [Gemmatimonadota bacterium]|nr:tRNA (adenosine(37)-N6)-threonylcarbamoyltransferase complex dimerization subunit type 1 TsaB [Gemmatimonadota bacterium]
MRGAGGLRTPSAEGAGPRIVLAIDTATAPGAVALRVGGKTLRRTLDRRAAFREAAPAIESLRAEAGLDWPDLDALAVPAGPGSFTGLRVGAAMAIGLARITDRVLYGVPTLAAVAQAFTPPSAERVCATLDARRGRWYAALYERAGVGRWKLLEGPLDADPAAVEASAAGAPVVAPDPGDAAGVAVAICALVVADPAAHALASPEDLKLVYARPAVDAR